MEREPDALVPGPPTQTPDLVPVQPSAEPEAQPCTIHRIGGATVENLRLKAKEAALSPPGISVIKASAPAEAAQEIRSAFPAATGLHEQAKTIGSASIDAIRKAGFDVIPKPSKALPNHQSTRPFRWGGRFSDENLVRLAEAL
jgi:hypothetical protein